ncbi:glycosyltransferase family 2 protein [Fundidesulfovibrio agrisoli]|uniref:glycosyltransferase family 2 protein n=1 Tax=Fundidesulfovibrio agrisoli TaxID=2922717 RepID=UPI001FAE4A0B|nr:glycosyltransferase family 2 protein [Fundidesulfovibrio agrisoli]
MTLYSKQYADALPKFDRGVSLVSWAYNEEILIEGFLRRADAMLSSSVEDYEIVVVDDGSKDRTPEILARLSAELPRLRVVTNEVNRNVGYSSRRAVASATKEYLFWQTVDWSYDITLLRIFLEFLKTCDVVAGVRRAPVTVRLGLFKPLALLLKLFGIKHLTRRSDTVPKALVSVINYSLIRVLYGLPLSDYQNVVFYPSRLIQPIIATAEADSSFANPELLYKAFMSGASLVEVPINFIPREAGEAKGTRLKALRASLKDVFKFWWAWRVLGKVKKAPGGRVIRLDPAQWETPQ